jgi:hypothetical protein
MIAGMRLGEPDRNSKSEAYVITHREFIVVSIEALSAVSGGEGPPKTCTPLDLPVPDGGIPEHWSTDQTQRALQMGKVDGWEWGTEASNLKHNFTGPLQGVYDRAFNTWQARGAKALGNCRKGQ